MRGAKLWAGCVAVLVVTAGQVQAGMITAELNLTPGSDIVSFSLTGRGNAVEFNSSGSDAAVLWFELDGDDPFQFANPFELSRYLTSREVLSGNATVTNETTGQSRSITAVTLADRTRRGWNDYIVFEFIDTPLAVHDGDEISVSGSGTFWLGGLNTVDDFTTGSYDTVTTGQNYIRLEGNPTLRVQLDSAVPEPSSLTLFGIGVCAAGLCAVRRRRRKMFEPAR